MSKKPKNAAATPSVARPTSHREKDAGMSALDVKSLATEELPRAEFPAAKRSDFRVSLTEAVHQGIWKHASENLTVEICGVLVGLWHKDDDGPYASITQYIRCDGATQKFAEVTFTHDSWAQINKEMDSKYQDLRIIGWYHSHPNFGIFLSDRDGFIQQNFFSGPGQIALVVDPVRKIEGIFVWRDGKTAPLVNYWVDGKIKLGAGFGTQDEAMTQQAAAAGASTTPNAQVTTVVGPQRDMIGTLLNLSICMLLFFCGMLWSARITDGQMRLIEQGAVARYGVAKLYKPGFEQQMMILIEHQKQIRDAVTKLRALPPTTDEKQLAEQKKAWNDVLNGLRDEQAVTVRLLEIYGLQEHEKQVIAQLIAKEVGATDHAPRAEKPTGTAPTAMPAAPSPTVPNPTATPAPAAAQASATVPATPAPTPTPVATSSPTTAPSPTATPSPTSSTPK